MVVLRFPLTFPLGNTQKPADSLSAPVKVNGQHVGPGTRTPNEMKDCLNQVVNVNGPPPVIERRGWGSSEHGDGGQRPHKRSEWGTG